MDCCITRREASRGSYQGVQITLGWIKEYRARLFPGVPSERTRGNRHKLKHRKCNLNIIKNFYIVRVIKYWNRLHRETVESPSLEIFKTQQDNWTSP